MNEEMIIQMYRQIYIIVLGIAMSLFNLIGVVVVAKVLYEKYIIPLFDITMDFLIRTNQKVLNAKGKKNG